ncbi:RHS repeat-associated core domain-containing protein [Orenia metallireducens]
MDQDYLPFGGDLARPNQIEVQNDTNESYKYTGQKQVVSIGLYYYGARYYDPEIGRFTREDTYRGELDDPQSQHLYVYVMNSPLRYNDPTGHSAEEGYFGMNYLANMWEGAKLKFEDMFGFMNKEKEEKTPEVKETSNNNTNQEKIGNSFFNQTSQNDSGTFKSTAFVLNGDAKGLLKGDTSDALNTSFTLEGMLNKTEINTEGAMIKGDVNLVGATGKAGLAGYGTDGSITGFEVGFALVEGNIKGKFASTENYDFYVTANGYVGGYKLAAGYSKGKGLHFTVPIPETPAGGGFGVEWVKRKQPSTVKQLPDFGLVGGVPQLQQ